MSNKLIVSPSPHIRDSASTSTIMRDVLIALAPAMVAAVIIFGFRALLMTAVCVAACIVFEYGTERILGREVTISDLSAAVTGVILSFNLPVQLPLPAHRLIPVLRLILLHQVPTPMQECHRNPNMMTMAISYLSQIRCPLLQEVRQDFLPAMHLPPLRIPLFPEILIPPLFHRKGKKVRSSISLSD